MIVPDNIKVVNLSLGTAPISSYKDDPICSAVRKLVDSGVVVVAAAGNNGKDANGKDANESLSDAEGHTAIGGRAKGEATAAESHAINPE